MVALLRERGLGAVIGSRFLDNERNRSRETAGPAHGGLFTDSRQGWRSPMPTTVCGRSTVGWSRGFISPEPHGARIRAGRAGRELKASWADLPTHMCTPTTRRRRDNPC